ncbi:hypothetical protein TI39_contig298g00030 [Zymoseptoria brevis]|uniref:Uncharacterized protein n=1 Tax=Zymoseptoria brevis TaxID=1047168 RepID=A0A0F4GV57_9PEZI|nr:hypothetical protein TI39_contig298g00030 [Zymoseptoria brevis]
MEAFRAELQEMQRMREVDVDRMRVFIDKVSSAATDANDSGVRTLFWVFARGANTNEDLVRGLREIARKLEQYLSWVEEQDDGNSDTEGDGNIEEENGGPTKEGDRDPRANRLDSIGSRSTLAVDNGAAPMAGGLHSNILATLKVHGTVPARSDQGMCHRRSLALLNALSDSDLLQTFKSPRPWLRLPKVMAEQT